MYVMTDATRMFNSHAVGYNGPRRRLIPPFDAFYGTAVEAIGLGGRQPDRVLDLGAGTGLLSTFVRAAYPAAHLTLLDSASLMLDQGRQALGDDGVTYIEADLHDPLPEGNWDAVVSALAIHHLSDDAKRTLMRRIHDALAPRGVFVNADQVAGPTPFLEQAQAAWQESRARAAGSDDPEWAAAVERMSTDRCAMLEDQLAWLREAGFADVDCLFKDHQFAVIVAIR